MASGCRTGLTQCCGCGVRVSQREFMSNRHRRTAVPGGAVRAEVMASWAPEAGEADPPQWSLLCREGRRQHRNALCCRARSGEHSAHGAMAVLCGWALSWGGGDLDKDQDTDQDMNQDQDTAMLLCSHRRWLLEHHGHTVASRALSMPRCHCSSVYFCFSLHAAPTTSPELGISRVLAQMLTTCAFRNVVSTLR